MSKRAYRLFQSGLASLTLFIFGASLYFQYMLHLTPCPLCLMQRLCVFFVLFFALIGLGLCTLKRAQHVLCSQIFFAFSGVFFAVRQLYLQSLPADLAPACLPDLNILIHYFPWSDVLRALFLGSGNCNEVTWRWLGLSMPLWALLYFLFTAILSMLAYCLLEKQGSHH
jgi:disulfide bond formation protein DsbB